MKANQFALAAALILSCFGCASQPLANYDPIPRGEVRTLDTFQMSARNRYAIVIKGQVFESEAPPGVRQMTPDQVMALPQRELTDEFVDNDLKRFATLALRKGYDVYPIEVATIGTRTVFNYFHGLLQKIANVSTEETQLFIAYSGEGSKKGLMTQIYQVKDTPIKFTAPGALLDPRMTMLCLSGGWIKGAHCLLLNACESGVFAEWAQECPVAVVVIAACAKGYATTPCEPTGCSALYATFFEQYADDPQAVYNLRNLQWNRVGHCWTNFRHKCSDLFDSGLPISYEPVIYWNVDFPF
jgi:hypothetical protein